MLKTFSAQIASVVRSRRGRRNLRVLANFFLVLAVMITTYSITFHMLMQWEGQEYTWITGFYWTLTVMSTLGFGDITFHTDLGRLFSIVVLLSGMIFMLVLLPFTFIEFFYEPWMGTGAIMNILRRSTILVVAEGLDLFKVRVPPHLAGRTIAEASIREQTGCSVVGIRTERGVEVVPDPTETLPADADLVLIGTAEAEERFLELYGKGR